MKGLPHHLHTNLMLVQLLLNDFAYYHDDQVGFRAHWLWLLKKKK
jgi:hypothetical protein